jgi:hypothetical protein
MNVLTTKKVMECFFSKEKDPREVLDVDGKMMFGSIPWIGSETAARNREG